MGVYYVNLAIILLLAFPLCIIKPSKPKKIVYLALTFACMWVIATFRRDIGFDYQAYINFFDQIASAKSIGEAMSLGLEPGFVLLNKLMSFFIHDSIVMFGFFELLMLAPVAYFIYRYCDDAWLSTWIYATLTFYLLTMNFVRQGFAASIVLLSYKFFREKKPVPFILIILLAASFHKTALVMIPVYFLCQIRLTVKLGVIYAGVALVLYMTSEFIIDFITNYIFSYYKGTIWITEGFPLFFSFIPALIFGACLALKTVWEKRSNDTMLLTNLMMFNLIIWLFITRHFILERLSTYVYIFVLVALPSAISALKAPDSDIAKMKKLKAAVVEQSDKRKKPSKESIAALADAARKISDGKKYYWSAVATVLFITFIYHEYGGNVNGFHGVFPYQSIFSWLEF